MTNRLSHRFVQSGIAMAILVAVLGLFVMAAPAAKAQTTSTPTTTAPVAVPSFNTDIDSSLVLLDNSWERTDTITTGGGRSFPRTTSVHTSCTGTLVPTDDLSVVYVVTAGHCVDPSEGSRLLNNQQQSGYYGMKDGYDGTSPSGSNQIVGTSDPSSATSAPVSQTSTSQVGQVNLTIMASQPHLRLADRVIPDPIVVSLVDYQSFGHGDTALLQLRDPAKAAPPVKFATSDPRIHDAISTVGFSQAQVRASYQGSPTASQYMSTDQLSQSSRVSVEHNDGAVANLPNGSDGIRRIKVNQAAAIYSGMSGGPALNGNGEITGVNGASLSDTTSAYNANDGYLVSSAHDLRALLLQYGVIKDPATTANPGKTADVQPLGWWDALPGIVQWLAIGLLVLILLLLAMLVSTTRQILGSRRDRQDDQPNALRQRRIRRYIHHHDDNVVQEIPAEYDRSRSDPNPGFDRRDR